MNYKKSLYYSMIGFGFLSFITLAGGNILLGLSTLFFFIYIYKNKDNLVINSEIKQLASVIGFFLLTMLLSALFSGDLGKGLKNWADLWIWRMMPFMIMVLALNGEDKAKHVMTAALLGIAIGFACIIYQGMHGNFRAPGFFGNPMTFGGYLCVYLPLILISFLDNNVLVKNRVVAGVLFLLGFAALIINGTRGAWVALAPVFIILMGYYGLKNKKLLAICLVFLVIAGGILSTSKNFTYRLRTSIKHTDTSTRERYAIWESAFNMFKDHPLLGVGLGQYKDNYQKKYILKKAKYKKLTHAHNNVMQMLAENGIVGCAGFLTLVFYIFGKNISDFIKRRCPYSLIIASSTFALFVQGLTEYNFGNSAVMKSYWLLLGCMLVMKFSTYRRID